MPPTCTETTSATSTWACTEIGPSSRPCRAPAARGVLAQDLRAEALPPLRPAAFFCAVVPPCFELERELDEPDFLPPRLEEPGAFEILAARSFDMPFLRSPSYCFSFLTPGRLFGMAAAYPAQTAGNFGGLDETLSEPSEARCSPQRIRDQNDESPPYLKSIRGLPASLPRNDHRVPTTSNVPPSPPRNSPRRLPAGEPR